MVGCYGNLYGHVPQWAVVIATYSYLGCVLLCLAVLALAFIQNRSQPHG
jgi:hypothetical protein